MNFLRGVSERIEIVKTLVAGISCIGRTSVLPRHLHVEIRK